MRVNLQQKRSEDSYGNLKETTDKMNSLIEIVNQNEERMGTLSQRSDEITSVVAIINDIADKTNLFSTKCCN